MYSVIIVEDDPMVAEIEKQYVERNPRLHVDAIFQSGRDALAHLVFHEVDLILLDYYMPLMDGRQFLAELRQKGKTCDVIMITAANDAHTYRNLFIYGITDYLLKPFDYTRFHAAMNRFISSREISDANRYHTQETLDMMRSAGQNTIAPAYMEKGIQPATVDLILDWLRDHPNQPLTLETISASLSLSRVTMRRYMNHLCRLGIVESTIDYNTGGRPASIFRYRP